MSFPNGKRQLKHYNSHEESFDDFKRLWETKYGGFPTISQARKYTGNDNAERWLKIVTEYYYS